jgi:hypothetical protein
MTVMPLFIVAREVVGGWNSGALSEHERLLRTCFFGFSSSL